MIKLELSGGVSEICIGRLNEELYERINVDLSFDVLYEEDSQWFEIDDIFHSYMLDANNFSVNILQNDKTIQSLNIDGEELQGLKVHDIEFTSPFNIKNNEYLLFSKSDEEGYFGYIELDADKFEPDKLLVLRIYFEEWGIEGEFIWKLFYGSDVNKFLEELKNESYEYEDIYEGKYKKLLSKYDIKEIKIIDEVSTEGEDITHCLYKDGEYIELDDFEDEFEDLDFDDE
jgi:hypothetical protein